MIFVFLKVFCSKNSKSSPIPFSLTRSSNYHKVNLVQLQIFLPQLYWSSNMMCAFVLVSFFLQIRFFIHRQIEIFSILSPNDKFVISPIMSLLPRLDLIFLWTLDSLSFLAELISTQYNLWVH